MEVTKPYEFIGFGAVEVTKPYEFIGFGAVEVTKPLGGPLAGTQPFEKFFSKLDFWGSKRLFPSGKPIN